MKKQKKAATAPAEGEVVEGFVERNVDTSPASGAKRITLHVTEDGGIDWDKSKPGAADELLTAVTNDATMLEKIAACPDFQDDGTGNGDSSLVTSEEAGLVLDVLTSIEGMIFSNVSKKVLGMKVDADVVSENFKLTEEDHKRQDPLAATGLNQLQEFLQIDPRWRWALFLTMAHGAAVGRNIKNCVVAQSQKEVINPTNPATQDNIKRTPLQ
jgi:hypothetical protein